MRYRVRVQGPSVKNVFGSDMFIVDSPTKVTDKDGLLIVQTPPYPGRAATSSLPARRATGPSQTVYPRGGWTKVTITELLPGDIS